MADRGPADETLPAVMALKKTICQERNPVVAREA